MKKHITFLTAVLLFCLSLSQQVNAQLPAGVVFDGYKLEKESTQVVPSGSLATFPIGWFQDDPHIDANNTPDVDDLNTYLRNVLTLKWKHLPSALFSDFPDIDYIWIGGYFSNYNTRSESMKTNISGLQQDTWYTYS